MQRCPDESSDRYWPTQLTPAAFWVSKSNVKEKHVAQCWQLF